LNSARRRQQQQTRKLATASSHKRALSKKQLEGSRGTNEASKPSKPAAAAPKETPGSGGGSSSTAAANNTPSAPPSGGGGALFPLLVLAGVGVGGAYFNGLIPDEYIPDILKNGTEGDNATPKNADTVKAPKELKEVVEEVKEVNQVGASAAAPQKVESDGKEEVEESLEHPENGNRVDMDKINTFYQTVNTGRAKQEEEEAREAATKATQYNESEETTAAPSVDPMSALTTAANAMSELQSSTSLENSQTLAAARAALRSDLDADYFADLDKLSDSELRVRVVQLATEMSDRTKWEAVRLKEFLSMKEKEVGDKYLEILQKQRLEFENLLAQKLREQEDVITRQANAALSAKDESIQGLMKATNDAREQEMKNALTNESERISKELELDYEQKLQNELAQMKSNHATALEGHVNKMTGLQEKLSMLEKRLEISQNYESGSKKAHRVSAAALALANKLEVGEGAAVEIAALKGAAGDEGVISSAVTMIPKSADSGVPTVAELQVKFDESYKVGREAAMVPEGRAGLEGQLLGKLFAKLSVPPSPDTVPTTEEEGSVTDGILSLARKYVQLGDIEKAVEQLDQLKGQTAYVMNDWKSQASDRVSTERALKVIKLECALLNRDLCEES